MPPLLQRTINIPLAMSLLFCSCAHTKSKPLFCCPCEIEDVCSPELAPGHPNRSR